MDGFGAADVWMSPITDAQADTFFDANKGIGLSLLRIGISTTGANLANWSDATKAQARGAAVWAAPWSPPAGDKDNGTTTNGGHLVAADYGTWAATLAGFAATATSNGVTLYGVSAQNEPDFVASYDSCIFSGAQMASFVDVLGPALHALTPPIKLIAAEPDLWSDLWGGSNNYGNAILNDSMAKTQVDVLATHQYGNGAVTAPPANVPQHIWETEASGVMGSTQAGPSSDIANGIAVAGWIYDAIATGGASAWHYWWLISLNADNEGLLLEGGGTTKRLYTMGNFSKFVRPGYVRSTVSGTPPAGVRVLGFQNPGDGTTVLVAINSNTAATNASFFVGGTEWPSAVTPWLTSSSADLASQTAIAVTAGRFTTSLAAQSVTSFVGAP